MSRQQPDDLERVFPWSDVWRGPGRLSMGWSMIGSVLLGLIFFLMYLVVDLLATGGTLRVPRPEAVQILDVTGVSPDEVLYSNQILSRETAVVYSEKGIFPALWWSRKEAWGPLLLAAYKRFPSLADNQQALLILCGLSVFLIFLRWGARARARKLRLRAALEVAHRLREAIYRQTVRQGPSLSLDKSNPDVMELFTDDVAMLQNVVYHRLDALGQGPVKLVIIVLLLLGIHPLLTVQCLIPLLGFWVLFYRDRQRISSQRKLIQDRASEELKLLSESLRKTRLISGNSLEEYAREKFERNLMRYHAQAAALIRTENFVGWQSKVVGSLIGVFLLFLIGMKVLLTPEDLSFAAGLTFAVALCWMYFPLDCLRQSRQLMKEGLVVAQRIYRYLDQIPMVGQVVGAKFLSPLSKMLQFEEISYVFPGSKKPVLSGLNLKIPFGRTVAIVSTDPLESLAVASLLPRFIEPTEGKILVDGEDIAWATLDSLRAEVAYVGGDDPFFTDTVKENLAAGNANLKLPQIMEAAKTTHAHNFIAKMSQGYETVIGEHGEQLDVGQGFRLSLARALLRNPALLIIEEPTAPLDDSTKPLVDDAYQRIQTGRTVIYLPTRMSTLRRVDEIVLLHQSKVVAIGSHAHLVKSNPLYRHWEYVHFNEFRHQIEEQSA
ncbi:MAG: ABC transporter ATP-binding protein [Planctomycetales bacterium]